MSEENLEAKLKQHLKQEKVELWNPPFTEDTKPGLQHMQELAERYASLLCVSVVQVGDALELIRAQAVHRGRGNQTFRETSVATLELLLPREFRKEAKKKHYLETKLDVLAQEVMDRIAEEYGLKYIKLILNGRTVSADLRLDDQKVKNNSKVMVLKVSEEDRKRQISEDQKKKKQKHDLERTSNAFTILSERDGTDDPGSTPFLEIADQKGNPLKIPHQEKKALIVAMGLHEKGRALMKRKLYDDALCHLLQADQHFGTCDSALLSTVDNYAVLQLDIVWCYRALEALSCLDDGKLRLHRAEECFTQCYGTQYTRLRNIKGSTGKEEVLFLRLYLLQSLLSYIDGNDALARDKLQQVEVLYSRLSDDSEKMTQLMAIGFSERESRLALRACEGDIQSCVAYITTRRQEREELKQREREKRRSRMESIASLAAMGINRRDAARALQQADGDLNTAYNILLDSAQASQASEATNNNTGEAVSNNTGEAVSEEKLSQLLYMGFPRDSCQTALRLADGDVQSATQLLLDNHGFLSASPEPSPPSSSSSEEPSPSTSSSPENTEDMVNEVLDDISRHEEDYLDVDLEEERALITTIHTYLNAHA